VHFSADSAGGTVVVPARRAGTTALTDRASMPIIIGTIRLPREHGSERYRIMLGSDGKIHGASVVPVEGPVSLGP
jgi:hypothetical protein